MQDAKNEKNLGNLKFKENDYIQAIKHYSNAISLYPIDPSFFLNRAMAYSKEKNWYDTKEDCERALNLDPKYIKALLLMGKAKILLGRDEFDGTSLIEEGINLILKAKTLCIGQKKEVFESDLENALLIGRKILWYKEYEINHYHNSFAINVIKSWINQDKQSPIEEKKLLVAQTDKILKDDLPMKSKIPEYLLCENSKEIMTDPVITSEGHTYDKDELEKFISINGYKDPVTGNQIDKNLIIKNINILQCLEDFIQLNPWSYKYKTSENYNNIDF